MSIQQSIKYALENTVLCRGAHSAKESYEYAEKMEVHIKRAITEKLNHIIDEDRDSNEMLEELIQQLKG